MKEEWNKIYAKNGKLMYEGFTKAGKPFGSGTSYYSNGKKFQEGLFDSTGLVYGREYYRNGKIRFEGAYKINTGYGPNYPVFGTCYDEEGNEIKRYRAADANEDINPDEIKAAIEKVQKNCDDEMDGMTDSLNGLTDNALQALKVEGMTLSNFITSIGDVIDNFGSEIAGILKPLIDQAIAEHNSLQDQYNLAAKNSAADGSASCRKV